MKIVPLLDITSDRVSCAEQNLSMVSSRFPQRAAAHFPGNMCLILPVITSVPAFVPHKSNICNHIMVTDIKPKVIMKLKEVILQHKNWVFS